MHNLMAGYTTAQWYATFEKAVVEYGKWQGDSKLGLNLRSASLQLKTLSAGIPLPPPYTHTLRERSISFTWKFFSRGSTSKYSKIWPLKETNIHGLTSAKKKGNPDMVKWRRNWLKMENLVFYKVEYY